jgi:hypothetical protein
MHHLLELSQAEASDHLSYPGNAFAPSLVP